MEYEEMGARRPKTYKRIDQRKLETWTIWGVNIILIAMLVFAKVMM